MSDGDPRNGQPRPQGTPSAPTSWQLSLGRLLGSAARWATESPTVFASWSARSTPRRSAPRRGREPLEPLLGRLAEVLKAHADQGYSSLEGDPTFWTLIARINARRPSWKTGRRMRRRVATAAGDSPVDATGNVEAERDAAVPPPIPEQDVDPPPMEAKTADPAPSDAEPSAAPDGGAASLSGIDEGPGPRAPSDPDDEATDDDESDSGQDR